jgi:N-acetylglucosamine-6-sulfatase
MKRVSLLIAVIALSLVSPTKLHPQSPHHATAQNSNAAAPRAQTHNVIPGKPNIVLVLLDDQDAYAPYWEGLPQTAAIFRNGGANFLNAFSPTPICTPGRCTLLSGRLAHNTGVFTLVGPNGGDNFDNQLNSTYAIALNQLGYITAHFGKTWGETQPNPGWQRWVAVGGNNMYTGYGYQVSDFSLSGDYAVYDSDEYITDFLADKAVDFLEHQAGSSQPFFVSLASTAPHLPLPPPVRYINYAHRLWNGKLPIRANYNEHDVADKSRWLRSQAAVRSACVPYAEWEYYKRMGSLLAVDDMITRIQDVLINQGKWNNTILVVTSDNGYNLGSHRLIHKMAPYEESIRVPMYFAGPGIAKSQLSSLVGLHDLGPTFIEIAGGGAPGYMDGKSLVPFLTQGSDAAAPNWRTSLVTEYDTGGVHAGFNPGGAMRVGWELDIPTYRSVRTQNLKYIHWLATGEEEVYDLNADPYELTNLTRTNKAEANALLPTLRFILASELHCAGVGCP